jgi:hypothetical protein
VKWDLIKMPTQFIVLFLANMMKNNDLTPDNIYKGNQRDG